MSPMYAVIVHLALCSGLLLQDPAPTSPTTAKVKMETTLGDFVLELDGGKAPITVQNFLTYCDDGFYAGTVFHRVKSDFMIQAGGFDAEINKKTQGMHEPILLEASNGLNNEIGTIAMARGGQPNSATAQFFINVVDNTKKLGPGGVSKDGYTVFGKVVDGMDTIEKIRDTTTHMHPKYRTRDGAVTPVEAVVIKKTTIIKDVDRSVLAGRCDAAVHKAQTIVAQVKAAKEIDLQEYITKTEAELGKKFVKEESGMMYVILQEGSGDTNPAATDSVKVHYTGWLLDGTKFDSSVDRGAPAEFPLNRVIKGWTVGVGMMKVGEKRRLIIPSDMGYGKRGSPPVIPPDATLVFDVELLEIK